VENSKIIAWALILGLMLSMGVAAGDVQAKSTYVEIGTGEIDGVYYPAGSAIAKLVNTRQDALGIHVVVKGTEGSVFNINAVMSGKMYLGLAQSDRQYEAYNGAEGSEWAGKPQKDLRAVFSLYPETVTLVAAVDSGINSVADLKDKRVHIGDPGSGVRQNAIDAMTAFGLDWQSDVDQEKAEAYRAVDLLQAGRIDAFFYTVGHPNGALLQATAGANKVRFVEISGPGIDALLKTKPHYAKAVVPIKAFYESAANESDVESFGVKATLVTSAKVPDELIYVITKEVFANLAEFKNLYPAFYGLTKENMLEGLTAPIHPGALRYYKEAGLIK
jgi:TRAP transporter TAXI family solute receptor